MEAMHSVEVPVVAFDESGNTGAHLLDPEQPVAVVASVLLAEDDAADLLDEVRDRARRRDSHELKFSGLAGSGRGRDAVFGLLTDERLDERVAVAIADKDFMLVCKLVDLTVEPAMFESGLNMYEDKANLGFANFVHFTAPHFSDPQAWARMKAAFAALVASPDEATLAELFRVGEAWKATFTDQAEHLDMLVGTLPMVVDALSVPGDPRDNLDPALPMFVALINAWDVRLRRPFQVLHDRSAVIKRWASVFEAQDRVPDPRHPGEFMPRLHIPEGGIDPHGESKDHARLQVVDLVAGAARVWARALAVGTDQPPWGDRMRSWVENVVWPHVEDIAPGASSPPTA